MQVAFAASSFGRIHCLINIFWLTSSQILSNRRISTLPFLPATMRGGLFGKVRNNCAKCLHSCWSNQGFLIRKNLQLFAVQKSWVGCFTVAFLMMLDFKSSNALFAFSSFCRFSILTGSLDRRYLLKGYTFSHRKCFLCPAYRVRISRWFCWCRWWRQVISREMTYGGFSFRSISLGETKVRAWTFQS